MTAWIHKKWLGAGGIATLVSMLGVVAKLSHCLAVEEVKAYVRGDEAVVFPAVVELGDCEVGATVERQVQIANLTASPMTVTGISTPCSCVMTDSLPVNIASHTTQALRLTIHMPEQPGDVVRTAEIYTSSKVSPRFSVIIEGRSRAKDSAVGSDSEAVENGQQEGKMTAAERVAAAREPDLAGSENAVESQSTAHGEAR